MTEWTYKDPGWYKYQGDLELAVLLDADKWEWMLVDAKHRVMLDFGWTETAVGGKRAVTCATKRYLS